MAILNPNYDEAPKLPPGRYRARIVTCEPKVSNKGNAYLNWKFETISANPATHRRWVFAGTPLAGKGVHLIRSIVRAAFDPNYEKGPFDTDHVMGKEVLITVERTFAPDGSENPYPQVMVVEAVQDVGEEERFDSYEGCHL